jgi:hypothetical protein
MLAPRHTSLIARNYVPNGAVDPFSTLNAVSLMEGEKRETVTDLEINTGNGVLGIQRTYRQFFQDTLRFMGAGWSHSHHARLRDHNQGLAFFIMPDGGEIGFYSNIDGQFHRGFPGISADMFWYYQPEIPERHFEITFVDGTRYWFGGPNNMLTRIFFPNGRYWSYTYQTTTTAHDMGLLRQVSDEFGNTLHFRYHNAPGTASHRQLWRVGDQTVANITSPTGITGRYVEYTYTTSSVGNIALLTGVRDVNGNPWAYSYNTPVAWRSTNLFPLHRVLSPPVASHSTDFNAANRIRLKNIAYTWQNGVVNAITQSLGRELSGTFQVTENYTFQRTAAPRQTQIEVAGRTTTHKFDQEVYDSTTDPAGNTTSQALNNNYQITQWINGNNDPTSFSWSASGLFLQQVTDPEAYITTFEYENNDSVNGRLIKTIDALGRRTEYEYQDPQQPRQPSRVRIFAGGVYQRETHFLYGSWGTKTHEIEVTPTSSGLAWNNTFSYYTSTTNKPKLTQILETTYNAQGLPSRHRRHALPTGSEHEDVTLTYDSLGRVIKRQHTRILGDCQFQHLRYDNAGNITSMVCGTGDLSGTYNPETLYDPNDPNRYRVTIHQYDTMGRRIVERTNVGSPHEEKTYSYYDAMSRPIRTVVNVTPAATSWEEAGRWQWDEAQQVWKRHTDGTPIEQGVLNDQNLIEEREYNEIGKLRLKRAPDKTVTLYGYAATGKLLRVIENASNTSFFITEPDLEDRLRVRYYTISPDPDRDIETLYSYDAAGNITHINRVKSAATGVFETVTQYTLNKRGDKPTEVVNPVTDHAERAKPDQQVVTHRFTDEVGRVARVMVEADYREWLSPSAAVLLRGTLFGYDWLDRQLRTIESASDLSYVVATETKGDHSLAQYPTGTTKSDSDRDIFSHTWPDSLGRRPASKSRQRASLLTHGTGLGTPMTRSGA